ncbi:13399_t:CDS:2 [Funneliformis caledonium]|uniref:13399_t:CDS:1 n=1 Tax=Funneliformis caledonium TaxID=1117310 RepID=A0A9N9GRS4_9GLOM|nr:13399_t:CDS:2 [Funneliformis caledonium]
MEVMRSKNFNIYTNDELDAMDKDTLQEEIDDLKDYRIREKEYLSRVRDLEELLLIVMNMITLGENSEFEFCDSLDPFSEGIIFSVMPPKKCWNNISDGEKTLGSLALIFTLHHFKPNLYVLDEIDASIVVNIIKERTKFIVINLCDKCLD